MLDAARSDGVKPSREAASLVRFAGLVLNLDACMLARESGEAIPLTHGELAVLRMFVSRPGRVITRDTLLDAFTNRRFEPFDRSVDVLVGKLRRKIETDPKQPCLIVTVSGEGYRFDGFELALAALPATNGQSVSAALEASPVLPIQIGERRRIRAAPLRSAAGLYVMAILCLALTLALSLAWRHSLESSLPSSDPPSLVVLPFANLTGDSAKDYLGRALALEVSTFLGAYPGLRLVSTPASVSDPTVAAARVAQVASAQYVVQGGVHLLHDSLRVTVTLYDDSIRTVVWSQVFDPADVDPFGPQEDIARRIYDSLAGIRGQIRRNEERAAWGKPNIRLGEYDYYLRGQSVYLQSTLADVLNARTIYQEGLERYPASALLRINLAWTYIWAVTNQVNPNLRPDIDQAWGLANEALSTQPRSPLEAWLAHWLMAFLYQWHDEDFSRSVAEARTAVALAPYDASSRGELSWVLANAGYGDEAVAWGRAALDHDPNDPSRHRANLAWAYFVAGRDREAIEILPERSTEYSVLLAALYARLGQVEKARALIANYLRSGRSATIRHEDNFPIVEPVETEYLNDLRMAGLPEM
jgi:adenylate cyclase